MKIGFLVSLVVLVMITGCVTVDPIEFDESVSSTSLKEESIDVVVYQDAELNLSTPGRAVGTGLIDSLTRPDGSKIALPSLSYLTAKKFKERTEEMGLSLEPIPEKLIPKDGKYIQKGKFVFEFHSDVVFLGYKALAWTTYEFMLHGHVTLKGQSGKVIWQQPCKVGADSEREFQLNKSEFQERLAPIYQLAAETCANQLADSIESII